MTSPTDQANSQPPLIGIVGPTASGKTELAMELAQRLPVEILVADSRQVYRGMEVGTAKPDPAARAAVPHHLLDLADPDEAFTVAQWVERARAILPDVAARGRHPLLVGGSGLYVTALLDGHDYAGQGWSPQVRAGLTRALETDGLEPLVSRLVELAPDVAARTDLRNPRRVVRALERAEAGSGGVEPVSQPHGAAVALIGIDRPRDELYRRIDERAAWLFANGLLDEVRELLDAGYGPELRPMTGHGYGEAAAHLSGQLTLADAIARTAQRTRQYAKRQLTWFRRDDRIRWLAAGSRRADDRELVDGAERVVRGALSRPR